VTAADPTDRSGVLRSAGVVSGLTTVSRFLGFGRDILLAGLFGTSAAMSAFAIAYRIPNLFRALFGEGALSAAFIPVFIESRQNEGDAAAWRLARSVFTLIGGVLLLLVVLGIAAAGFVLAGDGLSPTARLTWSLLRIMLPYLLFICLAAVSMGALNAFHHFAVPAATPWILNLVQIAVMIFVCPRLGTTPEEQIYGVAWGVVVAGVLQWAAQVPVLVRKGADLRPGLDVHDARLGRVLTLMGPAALGRAVSQFNVFFATMLAASIGEWAAAALYFSERLIYLPQGIFATALSTVLLPLFSGHGAQHDLKGLRDAVNHATRVILFVMLPAAVGLFVLAEPILRMSFEWRQFGPESTMLTARSLRVYCAGLIFFGLGKVVVPAFYGMQDTRTPVRVGIITVLANLAMSLTFRWTWPLHYKHAGLAFSVVASEALNCLILTRLLEKRLGPPDWPTIGRSLARDLTGCAALAVAAFFAEAGARELALQSGLAPKLAQIAGVVAGLCAGIVTYVVSARLLKSPELSDFVTAFRGRRRRAGPRS
jgi:putative peptidoglycan lipid II flippase